MALFSIIFVYTNGLLQSYFQQDEWGGFGTTIFLSTQPFWQWFNIAGSYHFIPLGQLLWLLLYKLFAFQAQYYVLTALLLHGIASVLVYVLAKKISRNQWIGILTAILFATNSRASQAFTHLAIFSTTITSFIFIVSFFIYLAHISKEKIFRKKDAVILILLFVISLCFREDGVVIIPLFFCFLLIFDRKKFNKGNLTFFICFFGGSLLFLFFRLLLQLGSSTVLSITGRTYIANYFYNVLTIPFKFIMQNIFDGGYLYSVILKYGNYIYPNRDLSMTNAYPVFVDLFAIITFSIIVLLLIVFSKIAKNRYFSKCIFFAITWILANSFLLAAVDRPLYVVESRYLYLSSFAVLFILSFTLIIIFKSKSYNIFTSILKKILVLIIVTCFLVTSYMSIQDSVKQKQFYSESRKLIISEIMKLHPRIPKETIFYLKCKSDCSGNSLFNVPADLVLPFTSGAGWVILVNYAKGNEAAYGPFFEQGKNGEYFLWGMYSQGYRKIGNYGFGYFREIALLKKSLEDEHLDKKIVIGLEYDDDNFSVKDISSTVQKQL